MAAIKYKVKLAESERTRLNEVSHRGKPPVRTVKRALALLKADEGIRDGEIAGALLINAATVARVRKRFVEEGLEAAINDKPRPGRERKLDGKQEARLVAIACSSPPEGHVNWTLHPWRKKEWCIPKLSGEFVARMEDVLDLYHEEYDRECPVVCFDETSKQLLGDVRPPIEAAPGRVERYDTEYQRNGTRNLFMFCEPKGGWRHVEVTGSRTAVDFAHQRSGWLTRHILRPQWSGWSWTISTPTSPARSTKRLRRPRRAA